MSREEAGAVIALLNERHPPGSQWRWEFSWVGNPRRGRIGAQEEIDLTTILLEAGAHPLEPQPPAQR